MDSLYTFNKSYLYVILGFAFCLSLIACSDTGTGMDSSEEKSQLELNIAEDIPADTASTGEYTFYSLRANTIVEDSASTDWDIAFAATTIRFNSGTSGPGEGGAVLLDVPFDEVTIAPSEGYNIDAEGSLAIPIGDENGWYNYTSTDQTPNHTVLPIENKTIVLKTGNGENYAKLRIMSYYKGNPKISSDQQFPPENDRYYTFKHAIQLDGSAELN